MKTIAIVDADGFVVSVVEAEQVKANPGFSAVDVSRRNPQPSVGDWCDIEAGDFYASKPAKTRREVLADIAKLEAKADGQRVRREALLGNTTYLAQLDAQIAELRGQL